MMISNTQLQTTLRSLKTFKIDCEGKPVHTYTFLERWKRSGGVEVLLSADITCTQGVVHEPAMVFDGGYLRPDPGEYKCSIDVDNVDLTFDDEPMITPFQKEVIKDHLKLLADVI